MRRDTKPRTSLEQRRELYTPRAEQRAAAAGKSAAVESR
jgi:hypothetical protein